MTTDDLLTEIKTKSFAIVEAKDLHAMFPGRPLSKVEMEFKLHLAEATNDFDVVDGKVSRRIHNPRGTSQHDVILEFCHRNQVQFRWGKSRCVFWRGMVSPMLRQIFKEQGEPEGQPFKLDSSSEQNPDRKHTDLD